MSVKTGFGFTSVLRRYCVGAILAIGAAVPTASIAQDWWVGIWSWDAKWCAVADKIGSVTPAPIAITETEVLGYENSCAITKAEDMVNVGAVLLTLKCQSEGETYEEQRLILRQSEKTIWMWWGGDEPVPFQYCGG